MLGRGQPGADLVGLAGPQVRAGDLARLVLEQVEAPGDLPGIQRRRVEHASVLAPALDRGGHRRAQRFVLPEPIEQVALPALVEQPSLVVLTVDLDETADLVGETGRGDGRVIEPGGRSAAGRDLADRDERLRQAVEQRLDPRRVHPVTNQRRVGAGAHRQPERVDEQALAGPCLAGDDVEAGIELDP